MFLVEGMSKSGAFWPTFAVVVVVVSMIPPLNLRSVSIRSGDSESFFRRPLRKIFGRGHPPAPLLAPLLTAGADPDERQLNRLGLEAGAARGGAHELRRLFEVEVHELAAARADGVVVPARLAVVAARPLAEGDLAQEAR